MPGAHGDRERPSRPTATTSASRPAPSLPSSTTTESSSVTDSSGVAAVPPPSRRPIRLARFRERDDVGAGPARDRQPERAAHRAAQGFPRAGIRRSVEAEDAARAERVRASDDRAHIAGILHVDEPHDGRGRAGEQRRSASCGLPSCRSRRCRSATAPGWRPRARRAAASCTAAPAARARSGQRRVPAVSERSRSTRTRAAARPQARCSPSSSTAPSLAPAWPAGASGRTSRCWRLVMRSAATETSVAMTFRGRFSVFR